MNGGIVGFNLDLLLLNMCACIEDRASFLRLFPSLNRMAF